MLNQFSWQGYWTFVALFSTLYYLLIGLLYYRSEILAWIGKGNSRATAATPVALFSSGDPSGNFQTSLTHQGAPDFEGSESYREEQVFDACLDELNAFFREAKSRKWHHAQLFFSLQGILSKYPSLKTSPYKESLGPVILTQCERYCSIHLTADELDSLW